jgi:peptide/nickel transport system permease protein
LQQPFVLSSQARGAGTWRVKLRHALPHAVLPGLALSSWAVGWLIGGSVAIEQIFARKGLGTLILTSVMQRDYPVIMGSVLVIAAIYVFVNLSTDLITAAVDRRQRAGS